MYVDGCVCCACVLHVLANLPVIVCVCIGKPYNKDTISTSVCCPVYRGGLNVL